MKLTELTMLALQTAYMQRDPTTQALCTALDGELKRTIEGIYNILIYQYLNSLDDTPFAHQLVDELAWQFHCDYYDKTADIRTKRAVVKQSIKIHQKKGTPQAVIDLLEAAFPSTTQLYEWFQYGGEPYHFKIVTSALNGEAGKQFYKALQSVKNARSICDGVQTFSIVNNVVVSRNEIASKVNYKMSVGTFETYTFANNDTLAFGFIEEIYSFKKPSVSKIEIVDNVLYVSVLGSDAAIIDNALCVSGSASNAEIIDNVLYVSESTAPQK